MIPTSTYVDNTELSETNQLLLLSQSFISNNDSVFKIAPDVNLSIDEQAEVFFKDIIGHRVI